MKKNSKLIKIEISMQDIWKHTAPIIEKNMKKILISREETQYDIIVKNQGNALEVLAELINQKMSLQVNPLMLAPVLQIRRRHAPINTSGSGGAA